jgi:uncharacterized protein
MQNVHSHCWDQALHFRPETVREADLSRGRPLDLTVDFDAFAADMAPFERVVVFGLQARLTGYWVPNEYVAQFVARAPNKLVGFAACDPAQGDCLAELRRGVEELGLRGLKLGPIYAGVDPRDPCCEPLYAYCEAHRLPVVCHTGTTFNHLAPLEFGRPWLFDEVAIRHPQLRLVLAHVGHPWSGECLAVIRKHPHVYADISALFYRPWQFYHTMILAQEYGVTHKLLFGTDYPFAAAAESIAGLRNVNAVATGPMPRLADDVIAGILDRDALGLLGVSR